MVSNWRVSLKRIGLQKRIYKKRKNKFVFWAGVVPAFFQYDSIINNKKQDQL